MTRPSQPAQFLHDKRLPAPMLGIAVVDALVDTIVSGGVQPGELLPPEGPLSDRFGVSRTVIRESVKRIEEKGLVSIVRGRGTTVQPTSSWNILDRVVLSALIKHDDALGVLDELSVVRAQLESGMAAETAIQRTPQQLCQLEQQLTRMRESLHDDAAFRTADITFHHSVMSASGNRLAESIARILFDRAAESTRYQGVDPLDSFQRTLQEHEEIFLAISEQRSVTAHDCMHRHILDSWQRRRIPTAASREE